MQGIYSKVVRGAARHSCKQQLSLLDIKIESYWFQNGKIGVGDE